jgi:hypothetical protein
MLALRGFLVAQAGAASALSDIVRTLAPAMCIAALPLIMPRYRSYRAFSWLLLIVCACELQVSRDRWLG